MSSEFWFADRERNNQRGPVTEEEIGRLIREGTIQRETLIWTQGMSEWRQANQVEGFAAIFGPSPPPLPQASTPPPLGASAVPAAPLGPGSSSGVPIGALSSVLPVWGLFWRALLLVIGMLFIVPAPWTYTSFNKFLCEHTMLPDGKGLRFAGKPGDIWYVFIALAALFWIGRLPHASLITVPLSWIFGVVVLKWLCASTKSDDGAVQLRFGGGYWAYIGWNILLILSFITIIGWAWVSKFMMRWICRSVRGTVNFDFTAAGVSILWRVIGLALACIFIIPVPWMIRWYTRWWISQVSVVKVEPGLSSL
jgi:hypothetical protein